MSPENIREKKGKRRYTFVLVPDGKSEKTRTYSITRWGFVSGVVASLVVIISLVFAIIIYSPVGRHLPISNPELAERYGKQIIDIQKQLQLLIQEVTVLRSYNLRLRRVMGEQISEQDSSKFMLNTLDTSSITSRFKLADEDTSGKLYEEQDVKASIPSPMMISSSQSYHQNVDLISKLPLTMPTSGFVTRGFDVEQFHYGIDYAGKQGSPVIAAADGIVVFANWTYEDGFMMIVTHEMGFITVYKHNQSLLKNVGESVKRGEVIALLGNTGETSTSAHLHFEVWKNGVVQDPNHYLLSIN